MNKLFRILISAALISVASLAVSGKETAVIADLGNPMGGQPYKFGGKELITANGLNEYDFGARCYYPAVPGFTIPDQLAEKYSWLSPYLYCANNPVNLTDPTGMYIVKESQREWESNRKRIEDRRNSLQKSINKTQSKGAKKGWSDDKIAKKIGDKQERVASLDNTLSTMSALESSTQGYSLSHASGNVGDLSLKPDNIIDIKYVEGGMGNFVHEVTHAGQFESGNIAFNRESGRPLFNDVYDEMHAYAAQYAYDPSSLSGLNPNIHINSFKSISMDWLKGISDSNGNLVYGNTIGITLGRISVSHKSNPNTILMAYPSNKVLHNSASLLNGIISSYIYYKK